MTDRGTILPRVIKSRVKKVHIRKARNVFATLGHTVKSWERTRGPPGLLPHEPSLPRPASLSHAPLV